VLPGDRKVKVVVGLGNPGRQYAETRHNIGWMVIDRLAERARWSDRAARGSAAATVSGRYRGLDLALVKPHTFMNLSGSAVRKALVERFNIEIGAGLGAFKGKVWRIGLMGYSSRPENVFKVLDALEQLFAEQKQRVERGGAVAAARAVLGLR